MLNKYVKYFVTELCLTYVPRLSSDRRLWTVSEGLLPPAPKDWLTSYQVLSLLLSPDRVIRKSIVSCTWWSLVEVLLVLNLREFPA